MDWGCPEHLALRVAQRIIERDIITILWEVGDPFSGNLRRPLDANIRGCLDVLIRKVVQMMIEVGDVLGYEMLAMAYESSCARRGPLRFWRILPLLVLLV